jgi:selenoprotein W-related protein
VPQAVSLSEAIMDALGEKFAALKLIPADESRFEVWLDGELLYSKLKTGEFPDNKQIIEQLKGKL